MTSDDVIMVLDAICEKLGIVIDDVTQIIPLYAKYEIFSNAEALVISVIATIVLLILIIRHFKTLHKEGYSFFDNDYTFMADILTIVGMFCAGFFALMLLTSITCIVEWSLFPEMKMINRVLEML